VGLEVAVVTARSLRLSGVIAVAWPVVTLLPCHALVGRDGKYFWDVNAVLGFPHLEDASSLGGD
jgi:hypothetical protein